MSTPLALLVIVAALFGAAWWADRQSPDRLERRRALVDQIERCKARQAQAQAAAEREVAQLAGLKNELEVSRRAAR